MQCAKYEKTESHCSSPVYFYTYDTPARIVTQINSKHTRDSPNLATLYHSIPLLSNHHLPCFHCKPLACELQDER